MHVCKVAAEWRAEFNKDVVIDLVMTCDSCTECIDKPSLKTHSLPAVHSLFEELF